jgi:hypothetical protein
MKLYDNLRSVLIPSGYKLGQIYPQKQLVMNDPAYLFTGQGADVANGFCQTTTNVSPQINTDFTFEFNFSQFTFRGILGGCPSNSSNGWSLQIQQSSNLLRFYGRNNNSNVLTIESTAPIIVTGNRWIKIVKSGNEYSFWQKANGEIYTQVGTPVTNTTILNSYSLPIQIGQGFNTNYIGIGCSIHRARFYSDALGANLVVDFNPNDFNWNASMLQNGQTFTSRTTGEVWTINSTGQGYIMPYLETIPLTRGSAGSRSLPSGVIESMAANMPRLDSPLNGCPGVLMEPPRTNLLSDSRQLQNWSAFSSPSGGNPTLTGNTNLIKDVFDTNLATLVEGTVPATSKGLFRLLASGVVAGTYTVSFYAKAGTHNIVRINAANFVGATNVSATYNLTNGTVLAGAGASIQALPNGWYRCINTFSFGTDTAGSQNIAIFMVPEAGRDIWNLNEAIGKNLYIVGAQMEAGIFASTQINTTTSTATRLADTITPASYHFIGLGNKGTIVVDYTLLGLHSATGGAPFMLVDNLNTNTSKLYLLGEFSNGLRVWDYLNGIYYYNTTQTVGTRYKVLFKWDNNYGCCYVNGVKIFEKFDSVVPYYFNYIRNLFMTTNSIRLNSLLTDNIAVSHLDCIKLTT